MLLAKKAAEDVVVAAVLTIPAANMLAPPVISAMPLAVVRCLVMPMPRPVHQEVNVVQVSALMVFAVILLVREALARPAGLVPAVEPAPAVTPLQEIQIANALILNVIQETAQVRAMPALTKPAQQIRIAIATTTAVTPATAQVALMPADTKPALRTSTATVTNKQAPATPAYVTAPAMPAVTIPLASMAALYVKPALAPRLVGA